MKNLNDLLARGDTAKHCFAERFLFDARDEIFCDLKIDIGFEQGEPNLPQRIVDVRFGNGAMAAQIFEDFLQLIAEL